MTASGPTLSPRLLALLLAGTMTIMAGATISPSLPAIEATLARGPNGPLLARLVLTVPALFTAMTALLAGWAIDRFGRRRILLGAIVLYGVAGPLGGTVSSIETLLATRAALGVSVGIVMTTVVTLVTDYYDGPARGVVMGRQAAFSSIGGIVFLVAGGLLADLSWRAPFGVYLLGLPILWLVWRHVDEPARPAASPDGPVAFPMPQVAALTATAFGSMVVFYLTPVQIPFYLAELGTPSGTVSGIAIAATTLTSAVASSLYGRLRAHVGFSATFALLYAIMALGYGVVAAAAGATQVIAGLAVFGLGLGLLLPNLNALAGQIASPAARGVVVGALTTSIFLGQFASPLAAQPLIGAFGSGGTFLAAVAVCAAAAAVFAIHAWAVRGATSEETT